MPAAPQATADDVFINCPFDSQYLPVFRALIFTIFACGFRPRSALELDDGGEVRIDRLYSIIRQSRYGIHDLSRTDLDPINQLPRFNMPLELGLFLGAKKFGSGAQREKRVLILDTEQYRYQRFISDLAGMDIHEHGGRTDAAMRVARNWLANVSRRRLPSAERILESHADFMTALPALLAGQGFGPQDIPYSDFEWFVSQWLLEA